MIPIKMLIRDIRSAVHDNQCVNYDDFEILKTINAGLRLLRRTIADIQPEIIMSDVSGILKAGEDTIHLDKTPMKVIELTAGDEIFAGIEEDSDKFIHSNSDKVFGNAQKLNSQSTIKIFEKKKLKETNLQHIEIKQRSGEPEYFYRAGLKTFKLYPIPRAETAYTLRTVDDIEDLKFEDRTPILNEFDDFLFEYCVMRLSLENEYDMTQEQALIQSIHQQIAQVLSPPPASITTRGYW